MASLISGRGEQPALCRASGGILCLVFTAEPAVLLTPVLCIGPAWADDTFEALAVFKEYIDRFDPTVADMYADDAAI
jgi:hypothetical protein